MIMLQSFFKKFIKFYFYRRVLINSCIIVLLIFLGQPPLYFALFPLIYFVDKSIKIMEKPLIQKTIFCVNLKRKNIYDSFSKKRKKIFYLFYGAGDTVIFALLILKLFSLFQSDNYVIITDKIYSILFFLYSAILVLCPLSYYFFVKKKRNSLLKVSQKLYCNYHPEIIVHIAGAVGAEYQLEQWIKPFEKLNKLHRMLIVIRQTHFINYCKNINIPTMYVPVGKEGLQSLFDLALKGSTKMFLYINNSYYNTQLLVLRQFWHIHLNHGDSDKSANALNTSHDYDYLFIAGQASFERHIKANWNPKKLINIGRPQSAVLINLQKKLKRNSIPSDTRKVIFYAPTFEGIKTSECYSSLLRMGHKIVKDIVESERYLLIIKLHPFTGQFSSSFSSIASELRHYLESKSKEGHIWLPMDSKNLFQHFATSDALIGDISSVCIDFLCLNKPLIATNPFLLNSAKEDILAAVPFWRGAYMLDHKQKNEKYNVASFLDRIFQNDTKRTDRENIARFYLGENVFNPDRLISDFLHKINTIITSQKNLINIDNYLPEAHLRWAGGDNNALKE